MFRAILLFSLILPNLAVADIGANATERTEYLRNAEVWFQPVWMNSNFEFDTGFNPEIAPIGEAAEVYLRDPSLKCAVDPNGLSPSTGLSWKFSCSLLHPDAIGMNDKIRGGGGKLVKLKVKYGATNGEVFGEVLSARLLWSLGFPADRMFFFRETNCFGCTENPFRDRRIDPNTVTSPRVFSPTAVERKFSGEDIVLKGGTPEKSWTSEGWSFKERGLFSNDAVTAVRQRAERDALVLLTIFINHLDNKANNQRLVCLDPVDANGKCVGRTAMLLHDVGSTFGGGYNPTIKEIVKADYEAWKARPIWVNASACQGSVSKWNSQSLHTAHVSEGGRKFLLKLLKGFSEGPSGRARVEALFRSAQINLRGGHSVSDWADVFQAKVREIEFPMGASVPDFVCPE